MAILATPAFAPAWDASGHRAVAAIAWEHMTSHARARAVAVLMHGPQRAGLAALRPRQGTDAERDRGLFMNAATWADIVRATGHSWSVYNRPPWHYADFAWDVKNGVPHDLQGPDAINAGERITAFRAVLADPTAPDTTKALALAWLLHLVGDIHQPLHCSSRVTSRDPLPQGDRGGNAFLLDAHRNLHGYWDGILEQAVAFKPHEDSMSYARRAADRIEQAHAGASLGGRAASTDVPAWEQEGLHLAQTVVYDSVRRGAVPSSAYKRKALAVSEERMALAGHRLAALLNAAFR